VLKFFEFFAFDFDAAISATDVVRSVHQFNSLNSHLQHRKVMRATTAVQF
jgi:hypothetical protein